MIDAKLKRKGIDVSEPEEVFEAGIALRRPHVVSLHRL
jgi:hypothetical protein